VHIFVTILHTFAAYKLTPAKGGGGGIATELVNWSVNPSIKTLAYL